MDFINTVYGYFEFLRPYKFMIVSISFVLFFACLTLAQRARKKKTGDDCDDD